MEIEKWRGEPDAVWALKWHGRVPSELDDVLEFLRASGASRKPSGEFMEGAARQQFGLRGLFPGAVLVVGETGLARPGDWLVVSAGGRSVDVIRGLSS